MEAGSTRRNVKKHLISITPESFLIDKLTWYNTLQNEPDLDAGAVKRIDS